jgi:hypothetical protein
LLLLLAACAALLGSAPLAARPLVEVAVIDRDGHGWLPEYPHRGQRWIAGTPGHRYAVRMTNTSDRRVLVVLSVDGVNAVTGETAHPSQAGYVLGPWQSTEVSGWRKSLDDVAQFVFTDLGDSYAARTGRPDNVGVIGVAVFTEDRPYFHPVRPRIAESGSPEPRASDSQAADAPSAARGKAEADTAIAREYESEAQRIGTGHGNREWAPVSRTSFRRASRYPTQVSELRYDDRYSLAARGILPREPYRPHWPRPPRAFPDGFVADPPRH